MVELNEKYDSPMLVIAGLKNVVAQFINEANDEMESLEKMFMKNVTR